jgi:hypothetical protein
MLHPRWTKRIEINGELSSMPSSKKTRVLTGMELIHCADSSPEAWEALQRCDEIQGARRKPVITHSEVNGYRVFDDLEIEARP